MHRLRKLCHRYPLGEMLRNIFQRRADNISRIADPGCGFRFFPEQPEKAYQLAPHKHIKPRFISSCAGKNILCHHFNFIVITVFRGYARWYLHRAVHERLYALGNVSVLLRAAENFTAENKRVISLADVRAWIYRVKNVRLSDNDIALLRNEFFLAADKFGRTLAYKIQLEFAVPMHRDAAEPVRYRALIITERLLLRGMYSVFLWISFFH